MSVSLEQSPRPEVRESREPPGATEPSARGGVAASWQAGQNRAWLLPALSRPTRGTRASLLPTTSPCQGGRPEAWANHLQAGCSTEGQACHPL